MRMVISLVTAMLFFFFVAVAALRSMVVDIVVKVSFGRCSRTMVLDDSTMLDFENAMENLVEKGGGMDEWYRRSKEDDDLKFTVASRT